MFIYRLLYNYRVCLLSTGTTTDTATTFQSTVHNLTLEEKEKEKEKKTDKIT